MADYIERGDAFDAVMGQFCACSDETEEALNGAIEDIRNIPAADVVEVVRCKDCKKYGTPYCAVDLWTKDIIMRKATENGYCSFGDRRELSNEP